MGSEPRTVHSAAPIPPALKCTAVPDEVLRDGRRPAGRGHPARPRRGGSAFDSLFRHLYNDGDAPHAPVPAQALPGLAVWTSLVPLALPRPPAAPASRRTKKKPLAVRYRMVTTR